MNASPPTVIAMVEPYNTWNTSLVRGIDRYATEHNCWRMEVIPQEFLEQYPPESAAGIFARVTNAAIARFVSQLGLPVINLSSADPSFGKILQCTADESQIGRLAAEHLLERGFQSFAYLGPPSKRDGYEDLMRQSFIDMVVAARQVEVHECDQFDAPDPNKLRGWIDELPKPVGLLAWNALQARRAIDACRASGVAVPEQLAVLCGEHDDLICEFTNPTITSVRADGWKVGYAASELLSKVINGQDVPSEPIRMAVSHLIVRDSTNTLAVEDRVVAEAVAFIRSRASNGIRVDDVVRHVKISRRALEQRFQACVGRSPGEEIRRIRLEHAQSLLTTTELTLAEIAKSCGMSTPGVLLRSFTRSYGITPAKYRKDSRRQTGL